MEYREFLKQYKNKKVKIKYLSDMYMGNYEKYINAYEEDFTDADIIDEASSESLPPTKLQDYGYILTGYSENEDSFGEIYIPHGKTCFLEINSTYSTIYFNGTIYSYDNDCYNHSELIDFEIIED